MANQRQQRRRTGAGGGDGNGRRGRGLLLKTACAALLIAGAVCFDLCTSDIAKERRQRQDREQAERNRERQRMEDSINNALQQRLRPTGNKELTPEQRRAFDEAIRRDGELMERAPELLEKYNRGEELTPAEMDAVHDYYYEEYYADPDDEGHYPAEIFDNREDYDEEHVRDNPGTAGED